ncbi:Emg1 [Scenedesmus sp. PABB004]|nr:Emg1 [Scenedesmus sp. PABB004]
MVGGLAPPAEADEAAREADAAREVIFVLESAQLEAAQVGKTYQLLNCDDHATYLLKHKKDPALFRPDITHQALLMILDSPLNKAGKVKGIYIHTCRNVLIQVNPKVRIPRTFKRFCGLMVQLLQKLSIRATNGPDKLLKVVKGPVTKYLPANARRVGFSVQANLRPMHDFVKSDLAEGVPVVFVVGAFAHGAIDASYVDEEVAVSAYSLSAAYALARITNAMEMKWGIL